MLITGLPGPARRCRWFSGHSDTPLWHGVTMNGFVIDCADCPMRASKECDDCLVTFLCDRESSDAVVLDLAEHRAVRLLTMAGLVPELRHPAAGTATEGATIRRCV